MLTWNKLVPELIVSDLHRSCRFWIDYIGFSILYQREAQGFVYLALDGAQMVQVLGNRSYQAPLTTII